MAYSIGEKPGVGTYQCVNCGWSVTLDDTDDRLPPCGSCGKGQQTHEYLIGFDNFAYIGRHKEKILAGSVLVFTCYSI